MNSSMRMLWLATNISISIGWAKKCILFSKLRHTGFPEKVVGKFAKALLDYGFKVAVVDQVETPD